MIMLSTRHIGTVCTIITRIRIKLRRFASLKRKVHTKERGHKVKAEHTKYCQWGRIQKASSDFIYVLFKTICQCRVFAPDQHWLSRYALWCRCLCAFAFVVRRFLCVCDYSSNDMLSKLMVLFAFTKCQIYDLRIDIFCHAFRQPTISIMLLNKKKCRMFTLRFAAILFSRRLHRYLNSYSLSSSFVILLVFPHRLRFAQFTRISLSVFNLAVFLFWWSTKHLLRYAHQCFAANGKGQTKKIKASTPFVHCFSFHFVSFFCFLCASDKRNFICNNN